MQEVIKKMQEDIETIKNDVKSIKWILENTVSNNNTKEPKEIMEQILSTFPPDIRKHFIQGDK